jgi:hypothetical protein
MLRHYKVKNKQQRTPGFGNGLRLAEMGRSMLRPYKVKTERQEPTAGTACRAATAEIQRPQGSESGALRYSLSCCCKRRTD